MICPNPTFHYISQPFTLSSYEALATPLLLFVLLSESSLCASGEHCTCKSSVIPDSGIWLIIISDIS